jgi:uncharacterized protein (TIGR03663 family)
MTDDQEKRSWLDRPLFPALPWLTNEILIFVLIVALTILSRFYNLGARVMSHDESLHTYFSWLLYTSGNYQHNPMMHGPLQFHLLALTYFLFGATDFTARLPHAISSILTVILLWKWRRYLGRPGTLIAAALVLISPYMLYYGRYARNEAFVGLFGVMTLYAILRYLETGKAKYIYLLTLGTVLHFTSKETAFIYTAQAMLFLGIYFIGRVTSAPWENRKLYNAFVTSLAVGILLFGAALGFGLYSRTTETVSSTQTVAPQVPGQTVTAAGTVASPISIPLILGVAAIFAILVAVTLLIYGYGWKAIRSERSFDMVVLLGTFVLPMLVAFPIKLVGWDPMDYNFTWPGWNLQALLQQGLVRTAIFLIPVAALSVVIGLWWNKKVWLRSAFIFYVIFTFFYTTFFTNGQGFFTGLVGSLGYWLEQQSVRRGSQPWYYYLLIQIPIYEFLPALGLWVAAFFGLRRKSPTSLPSSEPEAAPAPQPDLELASLETAEEPARPASEGNHTFSLLFWWSISSFIAFTIAGEKMPWLTYHITLPMILITGWALGQVIERMDWEQFRQKRGWLLIGLTVVFLCGLGATLYNILGPNPPFQGKELMQLSATTSFLFSMLAMAGSLGGIVYVIFESRWQPAHFLRVALLGFFAILAAITVKASVRSSYISYDDGTEYLVYAHGARGIKDIMVQVQEISRRTAGENNMVIAYDVSAPDTGVSWPFTWYLRDYPNTRPFDQPTKTLREASVIIVDQKNFEKILPVVGDAYYEFDYLRMVWPNQDYFNLNWDRIKSDLSNPGIRQGIFDIWLTRDFSGYAQAKAAAAGNNYFDASGYQMATWEPSDKMRMYIRKDVAAQIWNYGIGPSTTTAQADPYEQGTIPLEADLTFGTLGQETGQLNGPHGIVVAPDGTLYVTDTNNSRIEHFSAEGQLINSWGYFADGTASPAPLTGLNQPWGVAVSPDGHWVYVSDTWNHRIVKYSADGNPVTSWGFSQYGGQDPFGLWGPRGIAVDANGNVFVSDTGNKRIVAYTTDGKYIGQVGTEGMEPGQFSEPVGLAFDALGNLYVADTWNQRIQSFSVLPNSDGTLNFVSIMQWDISGWYGQSLENKPYLAVDGQNHIFVTDPDMGRVLEFSSTGTFVRAWGGSGQFGLASGIAVDSQGRVWVSDALNARLMRFVMP